MTAGGRPTRGPVAEACPWTHRLLAALAALFLLAAAGQMVAGAGEAAYATWQAGPALTKLVARSSQLTEITFKREVQKAFREGGLYVPLEDVILTSQVPGRGAVPAAPREPQGKELRVWIAVPFRIPWFGTFVYMWPRIYRPR